MPYATTCSYKEIALEIGKEKAVRAVETANLLVPKWL
ncbi:MGMT family protein [Bacillus sp. JJ722]